MASTHHQEEHWNRMGAKPKRRSAAVKPVQGDRRRGEGGGVTPLFRTV